MATQAQITAVQQLYVGYLGRAADSAGLAFWADAIANGTATIASVATGFTLSNEYKAAYAGLDSAALVDQVYTNVLGRAADAEGKAYWVDALAKGTVTADTLVSFIVTNLGALDQATINNKVFVAQTYTDTVGDAYTPAGGAAVLVGVDSTAASVNVALANIAAGTVIGQVPGQALIANVVAAEAAIPALEKALFATNPTFDGATGANTGDAVAKDGVITLQEAQNAQGAAVTARGEISPSTTADLTASVSTANSNLLKAKALVEASGTAAVNAQQAYDAAVAAQKALVGDTEAAGQVGTPASVDYAPASSNYVAQVGTAQVGTAQVGTAAVGNPGDVGYVPASSDYVPASVDYTPASLNYVPQVGTAQVGTPASPNYAPGQTAAEVAEANAVAATDTAVAAAATALSSGASNLATTYAKLSTAYGSQINSAAAIENALKAADSAQKAAFVAELTKLPTYGQSAVDAVAKEKAIIAANDAVETTGASAALNGTGYVAASEAFATATDTLAKATVADEAVTVAKSVVAQFSAAEDKITLAETALNTYKTANADKVTIHDDLATQGTASITKLDAKSDVFYFSAVNKVAGNDFTIGGATASAHFGAGDKIVLGSDYAFNSGALSTGDNNALEFFLVQKGANTLVVIETQAYGSSTTTHAASATDTASVVSNDAAVITLTGVNVADLTVSNGVISHVA